MSGLVVRPGRESDAETVAATLIAVLRPCRRLRQRSGTTPEDKESWFVACREHAEHGTESLTVGGQAGEYPVRQVVGLDAALDAARRYFNTGERSPSLVWEHT